MNTAVTAGIDGIGITFADFHSLESIVSHLFTGVTADHFRPSRRQQDWYRQTHLLRTTEGTVLAAWHSGSTSTFGRRNLLQVHGLAFSDSALNAFRPLDLYKFIDGAVALDGHVSALDVYVDDLAGLSPMELIREQSQPGKYKDFIRCSFLKDYAGKNTVPFPSGNSFYYGKRGRQYSKVLIYPKHLCPHQRISEPGNQPKLTWVRYELQLRGATAREKGNDLLRELWFPFSPDGEKITKGKAISDLLSRHFAFVKPAKRSSRRTPQDWWSELLRRASL